MRLDAPRRPRLAVAGALLAAGTAALSSTGELHRLDQYAVDRAMPWLVPRERPLVTVGGLLFPHLHGPAAQVLLGLLTYPAAFAASLLLILATTSRLDAGARLTWAGLWAAGNAIEAAGKLGLDRPSLVKHGLHASTFDDSLPSGHTIRAILVAAAVASTRRHGRLAFAWAALVPPALVVTGAHTVTDVVAGTGVALALLAWSPAASDPSNGVEHHWVERGEQRTGGRSGGAPAAPRPDDWLSRQLGPDWVEVEPGIFRPPADADEERRRAEPVARAVDDDDIAGSLHAEAAAAGSGHRRRWWRRH